MSLVSFIEDWLQDIDESHTQVDYINHSDQQLPEEMNPPETPSSAHKRRRSRVSDLATSQGAPTPSSFSSEPSYSKGVRKKILDLRYTTPAINLGPPKAYSSALALQIREDKQEAIPKEICNIVKRFSEYLATPLFDIDAIEQISNLAPLEMFTQQAIDRPKSANTYTSSDLAKLLPYISQVFFDAQRFYADTSEEAFWYDIVRSLLQGPLGTALGTSTVSVVNAQTRRLCSELLPTHLGPIASSKIDFVLEFDSYHSDINPVLGPLFATQPSNFSLSAFNDALAARNFTAAIIEVKPPSGVFSEAIYQVAVTSAAVLRRLQILDRTKHIVGEGLPIVSWIVHGHSWYLNYAYYCQDGSIRLLGPYNAGNTSTVLGIFQIMHIVREVKAWAEDTYWLKLLAKLEKFRNTS